MAVPKKRRSKQSTKRHKTAWFSRAYLVGAQAYAAGLMIQRKKDITNNNFEGFGQKQKQAAPESS